MLNSYSMLFAYICDSNLHLTNMNIYEVNFMQPLVKEEYEMAKML